MAGNKGFDRMNIPELIKEAHSNAVERGFYSCSKCKGIGTYTTTGIVVTNPCPVCKGSKIDPNKNIGELLMLIVSELGEALEAHRCGRFANKEALDDIIKLIKGNSILGLVAHYPHIKNTFEDEIADAFIRLFSLCGYWEYDLIKDINGCTYSWQDFKNQNVGDMLYLITCCIANQELGLAFIKLQALCRQSNIPIEKHITAKMAYNRTRPHKHGKQY